MSRDTTVIPFRQPDAIDDPLSEVAREGARRMLAPGRPSSSFGVASRKIQKARSGPRPD